VESPTNLKPHYYFGVTVKDLHEAGDTPGYDDEMTYARITTPPPDVVPPSEVSAATHRASDHQQTADNSVSSTVTSAL